MIAVSDNTVVRCKKCKCSAYVSSLFKVDWKSFQRLFEPGHLPQPEERKPLPSSYHRHCGCDGDRKKALIFFDGENLRLNEDFADLTELVMYGRTAIVVDYSKAIRELLADKPYDSVSPEICDKNFPPELFEQCRTVKAVNFKIFRSQKALEFESVVLSLYQESCRPASLRESLQFGIVKPHIHKKISLSAVGSSWRNPATAYQIRVFPHLSSISGTRHVYLHQLDRVYPPGTFFLAVAQ